MSTCHFLNRFVGISHVELCVPTPALYPTASRLDITQKTKQHRSRRRKGVVLACPIIVGLRKSCVIALLPCAAWFLRFIRFLSICLLLCQRVLKTGRDSRRKVQCVLCLRRVVSCRLVCCITSYFITHCTSHLHLLVSFLPLPSFVLFVWLLPFCCCFVATAAARCSACFAVSCCVVSHRVASHLLMHCTSHLHLLVSFSPLPSFVLFVVWLLPCCCFVALMMCHRVLSSLSCSRLVVVVVFCLVIVNSNAFTLISTCSLFVFVSCARLVVVVVFCLLIVNSNAFTLISTCSL